jgi:hypothetical protein
MAAVLDTRDRLNWASIRADGCCRFQHDEELI